MHKIKVKGRFDVLPFYVGAISVCHKWFIYPINTNVCTVDSLMLWSFCTRFLQSISLRETYEIDV